MPFHTFAVANEFLELAKAEKRQVSPMKLQKLLYFAHGWHLAIRGDALLNETIEAWDFGPVVRSVYHEFKHFGNQPVTGYATYFDEDDFEVIQPELSDDAERSKKLIGKVWNVYKVFSAFELSQMTHSQGSPWSETVAPYNGKPPRGLDIPNELIKDYFVRKSQSQS